MLLIADIPYGFRMAGSTYDNEPFRFKQIEKMVKDFAELGTIFKTRAGGRLPKEAARICGGDGKV